MRSSRRGDPGSDSEDDDKQRKKASKLSGASLLAAEREKYKSAAAAKSAKGKRRDERDIGDRLDVFRKKLKTVDPGVLEKIAPGELGYAGEVDETQDGAAGDKDDDDDGWMSQ